MWIDTLKEMKRNANLNAKQIAKMSKVPLSTVNKIFAGQTQDPKLNTIKAIVNTLGYTLDDLSVDTSKGLLAIGDKILIEKYRNLDEYGKKAVNSVLDVELERVQSDLPDNIISPDFAECTRQIPYFDFPASAGTGELLSDWGESPELRTIPLNDVTAKADFMLRIAGDSMEPDFRNGDHVLVKSQVVVEPGQLGIFVVDDQYYFKELGDGELISLNPESGNVKLHDYNTVRCNGRVIGRLEDYID